MSTIKIYSSHPTTRLHYVLNVMLVDLLGMDYTLVDSPSDAHLNYSNASGGLQCIPYGLLSETGIRKEQVSSTDTGTWDDSWCMFHTGGQLPFDIFSAAFYLLSRYEEYVVSETDDHDRFPASMSILVKNKVIDEPVVNVWALKLMEVLNENYDDLTCAPREFEFISTLDIDQAWKYRNKGLKRNLGGFLRDLFSGDLKMCLERAAVLMNLKPDPFFNYDQQLQWHNSYDTSVRYFILLGEHSTYDKNIDPDNAAFKALIRRLCSLPRTAVGIHPSYLSNEQTLKVDNEIKRLKDTCGAPVTLSRQHFLMHRMPSTYQRLVNAGIKEEHTMGYSTHLGFRAGIAAPFPFYDLTKEEITNMTLYPFCAMDITPLHYMHQDPEQAKQTLTALMNKVKSVGGLFIPLWHNESLSESGRWVGWSQVYEHLLKESVSS